MRKVKKSQAKESERLAREQVRKKADLAREQRISADLEEILLELNEIRDKTIHSDYELSDDDKLKVNKAVTGFILNRIEKHIKPLINDKKLKSKYNYVDIRDLNSEIKLFLNGYFRSILNNGRAANDQIKIFLDQLLVNEI